MKNKIKIYYRLFFVIVIGVVFSCSEDDTPSVTANPDEYETEMFAYNWFSGRKNIIGNVLDNDSEKNEVSISIIQDVTDGALAIDQLTGEFTYSPNVGFTGVDNFTYQICTLEGVKVCDTAIVTLNILQIDIRTANDLYRGSKSENVEKNVLDNDIINVGVKIEVIDNVSNGSLTLDSSTGDFVYSPNAGFTGRDSFTYQVCDKNNIESCFTGQANISIFDNEFNVILRKDGYNVLPGESITMNVASNDELPDFFEIRIDGGNAYNNSVLNNDNTITFTPSSDLEEFRGVLNLTYTVEFPLSSTYHDIIETSVLISIQDDDLKLGDFYQGGIIFYLDSSREHGMVVDIDEVLLPLDCCYCCIRTEGSAIGTGYQNTVLLDSNCPGDGAPNKVINLDINGYQDWYIPSINELGQMNFFSPFVNKTILERGGDVLEGWIKSSTSGGCAGEMINFHDGFRTSDGNGVAYPIRAVRSF